jgi:hypothetical protein
LFESTEEELSSDQQSSQYKKRRKTNESRFYEFAPGLALDSDSF